VRGEFRSMISRGC